MKKIADFTEEEFEENMVFLQQFRQPQQVQQQEEKQIFDPEQLFSAMIKKAQS